MTVVSAAGCANLRSGGPRSRGRPASSWTDPNRRRRQLCGTLATRSGVVPFDQFSGLQLKNRMNCALGSAVVGLTYLGASAEVDPA